MNKYCGYRECCNAARMVCARCSSEFYCSKPCQIRAFSEHRFNCFELPPLRSVDGFDNDLNRLSIHDDVASQIGGLRETKSDNIEVVESKKEETKKNVPAEASVAEVPAPKPASPSKATPVVSSTTPVIPKPTTQVQEVKPKQQEVPKSNASTVSNNRFVTNNKFIPTQAIKPQEDIRVVYDDLKVQLLPKQFKAVFLEGDMNEKTFYLCTVENQAYLDEIGIKIAEYIQKYDSKTGYQPKKNEIVLAKFEDGFFRCVCKQKSNDCFNVFYIDYGNSAIVKEEDIRPLHKSLMYDIVSHSCFIENFPVEVDENAAAILGSEDGVPIVNAQQVKGGYVAHIDGL